MYENETNENILNRMLTNVPSDVDKREGSIVFDALAPVSIENELLYAAVDYFWKNTFGDTADRVHLIERAMERGLYPYQATFSIAKGQFTPDTIEIPIGSRFSYDEINFKVIEKQSAGIYLMECESPGTIGNVPEGKLIPIEYINGLETARLIEITIPAENEEGTEEFRARYLASFDSQAYGGNIADYKNKVNSLQGVGGVKVYPIWKGGGTVRIVFMTSEYGVPTKEHIDAVQTAVDPIPNNGMGLGVAPIGHYVTVEGVTNSKVSIGLTVTVEGNIENYKTAILDAIDSYFRSLNATWPSTKVDTFDRISNTGITVRISRIDDRILDIEGVIDVEHTTLNGYNGNLVLDPDALAVRGDVTWR